jgi:hypothetical protein
LGTPASNATKHNTWRIIHNITQCTSNKERRGIAIKDKRESRSSEAGKIKIRIIKASMDEHWTEDKCGFRGSGVCVVN